MFFGTPCISGILSIYPLYIWYYIHLSSFISGIISIYPPVYLVFYPSILLYIWYSIHLSSCISGILSIYPPVYLVFYPSILLYIWYYIHLSSFISGIIFICPPVYLVLYSPVLLYIWYSIHLFPCISGILSIYPLYIWYSIHLSSCLSSISRRYLEKICLSQQIFWFFSRLLQTILAEGNETQHQKLSVILTFIHLYIIYRELPSFMPFTNLFILQHRTRLFCIVHKNKLI